MEEVYGGVALVSCAWIFMAYIFMPMGPTAQMTGRSKGQCKWGDRCFMNLQEQAVLFFTSLWMHAVFVSAETATNFGWLYIFFRALYPIIWAVKGGESGPPFPQLFLSTFTAYGVNVYLTLGVALKIGSGINVEEMFMGYHAIGFLFVSFVFLMFCVGLTPVLHSNFYCKFFAEPPPKTA